MLSLETQRNVSFRVIEAHPSLGHAAMSIAATVNEETATEGAEGNAVSVPGRITENHVHNL